MRFMRRLGWTAMLTLVTAGLLVAGLPAVAAVDPPPSATVIERIEGLPGAFVQHGHGAARPSEQVRTPIPFSMVGFELPDDADVWFRTSEDGQSWSDWLEAEPPDYAPDPDSPEAAEATPGMSEPVWVGHARWLQTRVIDGDPSDVAAHLIDSAGLSRSAFGQAVDAVRAALRGGARPAAAEVSQPRIVARSEWGADESMRKKDPSYARRVRVGVVHHTAGSNDYGPADGPAIVRGIYAYHTRSLGWQDIGYNLLVDRYGVTYEGRYGGVDKTVIGAHAGGFNTGTFGVAVLGTFTGGGPPPEALESLAQLLAWKFDVHHLDVTSSVDMTSGGSTRYPKGTVVRLPTLIGHRDVSATECPGNALYQLLPAVRNRMLDLAKPMFLDHEGAPHRVTVVDGVSTESVTFSTRLRPTGDWTLVVRNSAGLVVHSAAGSSATATSTWRPVGMGIGRYTYTFSSTGRRPATDHVELVPPEIRNAKASPEVAKARPDGALVEPVTFTADLWPNANWRLRVVGPNGETALSQHGTGSSADVTWTEGGRQPGIYRWDIEGGGAEPRGGEVRIFHDVLERSGDGSDAIAGAVGLSRTAFSASGSADRAVVARYDVFADAMAGGPLVGGVGPLLLTTSDALDPRVRAELERVLPAGKTVFVLGGQAALSDAVAAALGDRWQVVRLGGRDRVHTAAAVASEVVAVTGATTALVARAGPDDRRPWADALSGGAYGAYSGMPVLLTETDRLPDVTRRALADLGLTSTVVLGGTAAISDGVAAALPRPRRVGGKDRADTAALVAAELWGRRSGQDGHQWLVATGYTDAAWTLALSAAPLAARLHAPLLLVEGAQLPESTRDYLDGLRYGDGRMGSGWVLGSHADVSQTVADEVSQLLQ